mgnify:CR=1 FL=1
MMNRKETGDLDYVVVKGKVRKRDKDGNDISADKLGTGGRRREDGTLSAQVYDLVELTEDIDDGGSGDLAEQLRQYALEERQRKVDQFDDYLATMKLVAECLGLVAGFLEKHPDVVFKIKDGVAIFGRNVAGQFQAIKTKLVPKKGKKKDKPQAKPTLHTPAARPVKSSQEHRATMTVEEVQNSVLSMLGHYIEMKKIYQQLSNTNVIDPQHLGFDAVIAQLEGIARQYPALVDKTTEASLLNLNLDDLERTRVKEALRGGIQKK